MTGLRLKAATARWRPLTLCALVAAPLIACQAAPPDGETPPSAREADVYATVSDSLRLWLQLPERARAGEAVPITFWVENIGGRALDLYLTGRPIAFDLIAAEAEGGNVVWRRLEDEVIPAILRIETLGPGETLEFEDTWDQRTKEGEPVPPGDYTVRGELLTEDEPLTTPEKPLRITAP